MSGYFEQEWQNALDGATIQPSASVWANIEAEMDNGSGRRNWVTLLLIAATITVAFAFPLTVGNSSFETQPESFEITSSGEVKQQIDESEAGNIANQLADPSSDLAIVDRNERKNENLEAVTFVEEATEYAARREIEDSNIIPEEAVEKLLPVDTRGYGLEAIEMNAELKLISLNDYYILPIYELKHEQDDKAIALLGNLGSGSRSVGDGLISFGALEAAADFDNQPNTSNSTDMRSEDGGTILHIGLGVELPLGSKLRLVPGLGFMNQKAPGTSNIVYDQNGVYQPLGAYDKIGPGTVFLSQPYNYNATNKYLNLPVLIKYPLINRRIKFRVGAGLSTDFMISHTVTTNEYGSNSITLAATDYRKINITGLINFDLRFDLNNNYGMAIEAGVRRGLTTVTLGGEKYPTSVSAGIVLFYMLR